MQGQVTDLPVCRIQQAGYLSMSDPNPDDPTQSTLDLPAAHIESERDAESDLTEEAGFEDTDMLEGMAESTPLIIDPAFVYIILAIVTAIGLGGFAPDARYTLVWTLLAVIAAAAILLDHHVIERPTPREVGIGLVYGALVGLPLLAVGGPQLQRISFSMFHDASDTAVFQMLAFVMPLAETLFFRCALQAARGLIFAGLAGGIWAILLFLPFMDVLEFPLVALVIAVFFIFVNFMYSYLRERFTLFAAWASQITVNLLLLFASRLLFH